MVCFQKVWGLITQGHLLGAKAMGLILQEDQAFACPSFECKFAKDFCVLSE